MHEPTNSIAQSIKLSMTSADEMYDIEIALTIAASNNPRRTMKQLSLRMARHQENETEFASLSHMVERIGGMRIEIFSNEHAPPHFHVTGPNADACFKVEDGTYMYGKIKPKQLSLVQDFFSKYRKKIVMVWNNTRPADCQVGLVEEDDLQDMLVENPLISRLIDS